MRTMRQRPSSDAQLSGERIRGAGRQMLSRRCVCPGLSCARGPALAGVSKKVPVRSSSPDVARTAPAGNVEQRHSRRPVPQPAVPKPGWWRLSDSTTRRTGLARGILVNSNNLGVSEQREGERIHSFQVAPRKRGAGSMVQSVTWSVARGGSGACRATPFPIPASRAPACLHRSSALAGRIRPPPPWPGHC